ncbi:MAG: serine/threonine-protein kinase [Myxococcota bacterium]
MRAACVRRSPTFRMGTSFGRYELIRKIAAGGMAEIFLARQWGEAGFFRDVVIKRLFRNLAENESTLRMFQTEAQILAHLNHPNIPQCMELGQLENTWFMTMEYVEGWTIADVWRAGARQGAMMPLPVTLGAVMQVCEALEHAHNATDRAGRPLRIVHRDVTPHNVMVTRSGVVKLMDFGVAKTDARTETEAGTVKGTFSYMAPEQVRARPIDGRADVFSLGVILYELTTGTRLFRGSDMEIMVKVVEQDAPAPSERIPDYPADLEEIVLAALRREPRSRIASAADLALHLEHFAMRHGLLVGPRTVAEFVRGALPATPVVDEELALVSAAVEPPRPEAPLTADSDASEQVPAPAPEFSELRTPPAPLEGFDDDEMLESTDRPVVLLDVKKTDKSSKDDPYLAELAERLAAEDDAK